MKLRSASLANSDASLSPLLMQLSISLSVTHALSLDCTAQMKKLINSLYLCLSSFLSYAPSFSKYLFYSHSLSFSDSLFLNLTFQPPFLTLPYQYFFLTLPFSLFLSHSPFLTLSFSLSLSQSPFLTLSSHSFFLTLPFSFSHYDFYSL